MKTKNHLKLMFISHLFRLWISIFISFISGYVLLLIVMYLYNDELFRYLTDDFFIVRLPSVILITLVIVMITKAKIYEINERWKRVLLSLLIPLVWGLVYVIGLGNEYVSESRIMNYLERYGALIYNFVLITPIVIGQIMFKPWRSIFGFITGAMYVAILFIFQIIYHLYLAGMIYDDWL